MVKTRHLFISHSWNHSGHYETVKEFLEDASYFNFVNHSVPKNNPIQTKSAVSWTGLSATRRRNQSLNNIPSVLSQYASPTTKPQATFLGLSAIRRRNRSLNNIPSALSQAAPSTYEQIQLRSAIKAKIDKSDIVLVIAGVYASYSKWIDIEIDIAKKSNTPILAIEYWGAERTSVEVKAAANKVVKWNTLSIVTAIRDLVP